MANGMTNIKEDPVNTDYENAFKIACALLNGDILYGIDSNTIFSETMKKDGCICSVDYEDYILTHLNTLMYGEEENG